MHLNQSGRSMVEMLGVLAIIGVLSVGAMSGYSKAMMKYKLNKFSEGLNSLLNYALQYTPQFETSDTTTFYNELMYKLNLIPDGMIYDATTQRIYDTFNNQLIVYRNIEQNGITETNVLSISMDTSDISKQMCQSALTVADTSDVCDYCDDTEKKLPIDDHVAIIMPPCITPPVLIFFLHRFLLSVSVHKRPRCTLLHFGHEYMPAALFHPHNSRFGKNL